MRQEKNLNTSQATRLGSDDASLHERAAFTQLFGGHRHAYR